jgi:hypothetical protein
MVVTTQKYIHAVEYVHQNEQKWILFGATYPIDKYDGLHVALELICLSFVENGSRFHFAMEEYADHGQISERYQKRQKRIVLVFFHEIICSEIETTSRNAKEYDELE